MAQSGRAPRSGRGSRWFKSSRPDHNPTMALGRKSRVFFLLGTRLDGKESSRLKTGIVPTIFFCSPPQGLSLALISP